MKKAEGFVDIAGKHYATAGEAIDSDLEINIIELLGNTDLSIEGENGIKRFIEEGKHRVALRKILNQHSVDRGRFDYSDDDNNVTFEE